MKTQTLLLIFSFLLFFGRTEAKSVIAECANNDNLEVILYAGTIVSVELNEEIDADYANPGNIVDLVVRSKVVVNNLTVISDGVIAEGRITKRVKSCRGKCIEISIEVLNVQTVDGKRIRLRSAPIKITLACCGRKQERTTLGIKISARTINNEYINA